MNREMKHSGIAWIGEIPKQWTVELLGNNVKLVDNPNSDCSEDNALQFKMGTIISIHSHWKHTIKYKKGILFLTD